MVAKQSQKVAIGCKEVAKQAEVEQLQAQLAQAQAALDKAEEALEYYANRRGSGGIARQALAEIRKMRGE